MKKLTAVKHDRGNCRLYVIDQTGNKYVIIDNGPSCVKAGLPQFELFTHCRYLEPSSPVKKSIAWQLVKGSEGAFATGLSHKANEYSEAC